MNILFIHQNMPGQFRHLAQALARESGHRVVFLTKRLNLAMPGVARVTYQAPREVRHDTHPYLRLQESAVLHGQQVVRALQDMSREGFKPDLVIGHPGWGELLFVKDVLPGVPLISYCEFFYRGVDAAFDPAERGGMDAICLARAGSAHLLLSLEACDVGISPTHWQKSAHPTAFQSKIEVIFDGIDIDRAHPDGDAALTLPDGTTLQRGDELVTYAARNLEPCRGFPSFMRALPEILQRRPNAHVVIVGGDDVSYGFKPKGHAHWREAMLAEVAIDGARVHFTGKLPYADFLKLMRASRAHVYLTRPFVLSWSCLEAMACGALVIGSDTPPVQEVIRHDRNGLLTDFFDHAALAEKVCHALAEPQAFARHRARARQTIVERYALRHCLDRQLRLVHRVMAGGNRLASVQRRTRRVR
jgi:glycosyltransferase involved in cell wall biosynthesis